MGDGGEKWLWQTEGRSAESHRLIDVDSADDGLGQPGSTSPLCPVTHCVITSRRGDWWNVRLWPAAAPGLHFSSDYSDVLSHKSVSFQPEQMSQNKTKQQFAWGWFYYLLHYYSISESFQLLQLVVWQIWKWWSDWWNDVIWSDRLYRVISRERQRLSQHALDHYTDAVIITDNIDKSLRLSPASFNLQIVKC